MNEPKIWAEGLYARRNENAPDWVTVDLGIDVQRFVTWLQKQPVSEKGYLTVKVTRSKDGTKYSAALDTWKPSGERQRSEAAREYAGRDNRPFDDQMPW